MSIAKAILEPVYDDYKAFIEPHAQRVAQLPARPENDDDLLALLKPIEAINPHAFLELNTTLEQTLQTIIKTAGLTCHESIPVQNLHGMTCSAYKSALMAQQRYGQRVAKAQIYGLLKDPRLDELSRMLDSGASVSASEFGQGSQP